MQEYSQSVWRYRMQMIFQRFGDTFLGQIVVTGISLSEDFTDIFNLCVAVDIYRLLSDTAHHRKNMTVYETVLGMLAYCQNLDLYVKCLQINDFLHQKAGSNTMKGI